MLVVSKPQAAIKNVGAFFSQYVITSLTNLQVFVSMDIEKTVQSYECDSYIFMARHISTEFALSTCYNTGYYRMGGIMTWLADR